jgi:F0F1-type ATP synthase assembly protein I
MKKLTLALLAVIIIIYLGFLGMESKSTSGPFFMFVGVCTAIGLTLDVFNVIRQRIRKANLRKLGINK